MSFAEKILKRYGWKEGDGLGKNLDGIAKPLKASLKFDSAGLGVDKAAEFNNHWWERVFNEAANNVQIDKDGDRVSVNVKNDESVEITTKDYSVRKLKNKNRDTYDNFLSAVTLTNTGAEIIKPDKIDVDEIMVKTHKPLTDEELFAACGGRTAHKGARHGLKLSGKLARIEKQEKEMLLQMQSAAPDKVQQSWTVVKSKKKKKNKEKTNTNNIEETLQNDETKLNSILYTAEYCITSKKKRKEKKKTEKELSDCLGSFSFENEKKDGIILGICNNSKIIKKPKKSKKAKDNNNSEKWDTYRDVDVEKKAPETNIESGDIERQNNHPEDTIIKKKNKKCKHGIDKEAKEAHKMAKKLKKIVKHATDELERSKIVET